MSEFIKTADVWTVLDLIVAEFTSDPMSVQCFDLRLVERAKDLNRAHRAGGPDSIALADAAPDLLEALRLILAEPYGCPMCDSGKLRDSAKEHWNECGFPRARAAIAKAAAEAAEG